MVSVRALIDQVDSDDSPEWPRQFAVIFASHKKHIRRNMFLLRGCIGIYPEAKLVAARMGIEGKAVPVVAAGTVMLKLCHDQEEGRDGERGGVVTGFLWEGDVFTVFLIRGLGHVHIVR